MIAVEPESLADWVQEHILWLWGFQLRPFQLKDLCDLLEGGIYSVLYPTDHGKSTLIQMSVVLGLIREPTRSNIIIKISDDKAKETLITIARRLTIAAEHYPAVRPILKNTKTGPAVGDGFYIEGADLLNDNPSIYGAGIATRDIQGRRGRTHIDDIESFREARSPAYQQILEDQVSSTMRTLEPRPDTLWAMFGTPYYEHSVMFGIPKRLESMGPRFRLIRRPIVDQDGRSLWEERRAKAEIHRLALPSELEWQVAYMLEPPRYTKLSDQDIKKLLDERYPFLHTATEFRAWYGQGGAARKRDDQLLRASWYIGWDPSASGEFGIVAVAMIEDQIYVLDAIRQAGNIFMQISIIADLLARFPQATIVLEKNGQQQVIVDVVRERLPNALVVTHQTKADMKSSDIGIPPMLQRAIHGFFHLPGADERGRGVASVVMRECYGYPAKKAHVLPALWFTTYYHRKHLVIQPVEQKTQEVKSAEIIPIDHSRIRSAWSRGFRGMNA